MKKLPFKPTALRRAAPPTQTEAPVEGKGKEVEGSRTTEDDGLGLFKRSSEMKSLLEADRERALRKIQKRAAEEEEQQRKDDLAAAERRRDSTDELSKAARDDQDDDPFLRSLATPPPSKRSKLDTPSSIHTRSGKSTRSTRHDVDDSPIAAPQLDAAASSSNIPASSSGSAAILIDDSDADSDVIPVAKPAPPRSPTPDFTIADEDDDDAMAEYVRKAKLAKDEAAAARIASLPSRTADDGDMFSSPATSRAKADAVEIILTSVIPNTRSSGAKVPFDKPLRIVRDTWVALQRKYGVTLPPGTVDDEIVLTWRRNKVYMSSSLQSLGIRSLGGGRVAVAGGTSEGLNDAKTRVHMEVWTPELFAQMEREEEARRRRADHEEPEQEDAAEEDDEAAEAEVKLRIILKPKDLEPFKLVVRPETTVQDLVRAFRKARTVADDVDVGLWFDGERLDEQATIEDADIDDMDTLDVHIK